MLKRLCSIFMSAIFGFACSTSRNMSENQRAKGHYRLYSYPKSIKTSRLNKDRYQRIIIAGTNDFKGEINPKIYPIKNRFSEKRELKLGGIAALKAYLDVLQEEAQGNLVYVDAGNFINPKENHGYSLFLAEYLKADALSLGVNELSLKRNGNFPRYIQALARRGNYNLISSNIFDLRTTEPIKWDNISYTRVKSVNGVKVGFIGIISPKLAEKVPDENINGLYIQNAAKKIIVHAKELRRSGVEVIVLLMNAGLDCTSMLAHEKQISESKVNFDPNNSNYCDTNNNSLFETLQQIPPRTVDVVFTSGKESKVANFLNEYPVLQNYNGDYLAWVELYFDKKHNAIDRSMTKIHQPIQLCHNFLKESQDCFIEGELSDQEVMPAFLFGKKIQIRDLPRLK